MLKGRIFNVLFDMWRDRFGESPHLRGLETAVRAIMKARELLRVVESITTE